MHGCHCLTLFPDKQSTHLNDMAHCITCKSKFSFQCLTIGALCLSFSLAFAREIVSLFLWILKLKEEDLGHSGFFFFFFNARIKHFIQATLRDSSPGSLRGIFFFVAVFQ